MVTQMKGHDRLFANSIRAKDRQEALPVPSVINFRQEPPRFVSIPGNIEESGAGDEQRFAAIASRAEIESSGPAGLHVDPAYESPEKPAARVSGHETTVISGHLRAVISERLTHPCTEHPA
jgi:hypothetical protein